MKFRSSLAVLTLALSASLASATVTGNVVTVDQTAKTFSLKDSATKAIKNMTWNAQTVFKSNSIVPVPTTSAALTPNILVVATTGPLLTRTSPYPVVSALVGNPLPHVAGTISVVDLAHNTFKVTVTSANIMTFQLIPETRIFSNTPPSYPPLQRTALVMGKAVTVEFVPGATPQARVVLVAP